MMEQEINGFAHVPLAEAAVELGTTPLRILTLIGQGVMQGCRIGEEWFVAKGSMKCFRSYRGNPSRSGGCGGTCPAGGCSGGN